MLKYLNSPLSCIPPRSEQSLNTKSEQLPAQPPLLTPEYIFFNILFQFIAEWKVYHLLLNPPPPPPKKKDASLSLETLLVFDPVNGWGSAVLDQANSDSETLLYRGSLTNL